MWYLNEAALKLSKAFFAAHSQQSFHLICKTLLANKRIQCEMHTPQTRWHLRNYRKQSDQEWLFIILITTNLNICASSSHQIIKIFVPEVMEFLLFKAFVSAEQSLLIIHTVTNWTNSEMRFIHLSKIIWLEKRRFNSSLPPRNAVIGLSRHSTHCRRRTAAA